MLPFNVLEGCIRAITHINIVHDINEDDGGEEAHVEDPDEATFGGGAHVWSEELAIGGLRGIGSLGQ